ncbi:MAG TPA: prolipoprotein diacylglyceryl transferase [Ruminococcaceae bacterium]|nr:prolipoprotein diacylglyceryl transferase [Oscillospiraceae bacterium]
MTNETVFHVTFFGLEFPLKPVAFTLPIGDGWSVYWYGILISLGFLLAMIYAFRRAKSFKINTDRMIDVILVSVPAAVIVARLYYILFDGVASSSFADIIGIRNGGLAIYGGIIGAFIAAYFTCRWRKVDFLSLFDMASIGFLMAQAIGRWGNFFNQEAFGTATGSDFFGMTSEPIAMELGAGVMAHPCFLYEFIWCAAGFALLHFYSKKRKFKGEIFLMYLAWYGFGRFFIEMLRTDQLKIGPVPVSVVLSGIVCAASVALLIMKRRKMQGSRAPEYKPVFQDVADGMNAGGARTYDEGEDTLEDEVLDTSSEDIREEAPRAGDEIDVSLSDLPEIPEDENGEDGE